ncbi:SAM-dependent methyltransferase [Agromyces hippuratus]|uniref:SAM-dependent methyltransferase n=1 Tax=Agromyces hippuratus TaxID=286438 RepID=A0A852WPI5_9MICO|nr:methyltransferase domain-containing protein [Agromyces hippuratus]NYG19869.1 SAM-dependent methyltransferase [Agromyces hippuratus]
MSIDSTWLRCPNCFQDLEPVTDRVLGCSAGHRFDLAKHGSVTLLPPKAPRTAGDDRQMLEARSQLLESGAYAPIVDALAASVRGETDRGEPGAPPSAPSADPSERLGPRIADLGCGTGYYARGLSASVDGASVLLADRSPTAVRMAMRGVPESTGVVLDLWRPLPLRDASADLAINVFAPRNPPEFARIVRTGGLLIVVVPTAEHFLELRRLGAALDVPEGKAELVTAQFTAAGFTPSRTTRVEYPLVTDAATRELLVDMGPAAHHRSHATGAEASGDLSVTVSVDVVTFVRRSPQTQTQTIDPAPTPE